MKRPIPKSTLLRFPILFGGFLAFTALGLFYKDSWIGDIEKSRKAIFENTLMENNPIEDFKKQVEKSKR